MRRQAAAAVLRTRSRFRLSDRWFGTFLVAPAIIVFLVVIAYPIIRGIWVSFCANKLKNINNPTWNDFKNYQVIFKKGAFWNYFGNTLLFCFHRRQSAGSGHRWRASEFGIRGRSFPRPFHHTMDDPQWWWLSCGAGCRLQLT